MGSLFGKPKKPVSRVTEQDKAILQLKQQRDKLKQYQKRIELNLEKDRLLAKKLLTENKRDKAKLLLRKKKYQEQLLQNTETQLENLERLTHDIEFAQIEIQVLNGLKTGNAALKKVHDVMSIEDIEKIMDESKEGIEKQREIDAVISGQLTQEDEDAIEEELEDMLDVKDELPEVPAESFPDVPTDEVQEKQKTKEKTKRIALEA